MAPLFIWAAVPFVVQIFALYWALLHDAPHTILHVTGLVPSVITVAVTAKFLDLETWKRQSK